jgi:hypothetical protein
MSIKTLVAGLSVCTIFLLSSWQPGIARTSFKPEIDTNRNSIAAKNPLRELGDLPNLLLVSQRISNFRANHSRKTNKATRPSGYQINRQNDPRFFQRTGKSNFSTPNLRSYSNRTISPTNRPALGTNKIRNNTNIYKRSKSRKYEYITPR